MTESGTWIAIGVAIGAAVLSLVLLVLVLLLLVRDRRGRGAGRERALDEANARLEAMLTDLSRALERAQEESRRSRALSGIGATIDLDVVLARTLEQASSLPGADAALVLLPQGDGGPLIASVGLTAAEASSHPISSPPARAIEVAYRYAAEQAEGEPALIRGGIAVPLRSEEAEIVGTVAVFWRRERAPSADDVARLEELAEGAGPALENARRFREARQQADLDALTGLHNRRYFHETLAREVARAARYGRRLGLVVFDIDDFKAINDRVGHLAGDTVLAEVAARVRSVVRSADVPCRVGGDEFAVILPESTLVDAEQLYDRLRQAVSSRPAGPAEQLHLSAGMAELGPGDDAIALFERADEALYRAKDSGKGRAMVADERG